MNIIDKNSLLNAAQKKLLQDCAQISFSLGKFSSIDDILTKLNVNVYIEPGIVSRSIPTELEEALKFWENETNRLKDTNSEEYKEARKKYIFILEEMGVWKSMPLRGLYYPIANVIKLYPEEMHQEYDDKRMKELLVSTLVHEAMHAYFNRPRHKSFPYVIFVEEPLAEFGMLLYLKNTRSKYYRWALKDVSSKRTCYKYGANLIKQFLAEGPNSPTRKYLEAYKVNLNVYDIPDYPEPRSRGKVVLPHRAPISVNGQHFTPKWKDLYNYPPRYFYDSTNNILGLDGDWSNNHRMAEIDVVYINIQIKKPLNTIYLGENFSPSLTIAYELLSKWDVQVSRKNKLLKSRNIKSTTIRIPVFRKDKKPALRSCGNGYYRICRKGKWGVIDDQLNLTIDIKYDDVWSFDKNGLIEVQDGNSYKLVQKNGKVLGNQSYDKIPKRNLDGTYTVKQNGVEFKIDQYGNKVP